MHVIFWGKLKSSSIFLGMPDRTGIFLGWSANLSNFLGLGVEAGASPMYPQKMRVPPLGETQLVQLFYDMVSNLDRALNRGHRQTGVIIMDFANAFDKLSHRRLLYKLHY